MNKPKQGFWGLWNISFGFFGIQIGFALQNANASRIFQALGSPVENLGLMWMAAPLTGLLVQPIIGHYSDRTWNQLGRRRPYFLVGAILSTIALFFMPYSPAVWAAAITLWILDASLNISMEPFRAFVGDMLDRAQRPAGYAFQTAFIGAGAVVASLAPFLLEKLGVSNTAAPGSLPDTVRYGFYFGGAMLFAAVLWTVLSTREYPPEQIQAFTDERDLPADGHAPAPMAAPAGYTWIAAGVGLGILARLADVSKEAYFVAALLGAFGIVQMISRVLVQQGRGDNLISHIVTDLANMPSTMKKLALVQFFTWGALITMWVYTTPIVAQYVFGATDTASKAYNEAGNWVGVLFAIYSGVATLAAFVLPLLVKKIGASKTHMICLLAGAASYAAIFVIRDANLLILPMIGIGIAWASILTLPYVILAGALPPQKLGIYMGIFNFYIVIPQLLVATLMGALMARFFMGEPIWTMLFAAVVMAIAALATLRVEDRPGS